MTKLVRQAAAGAAASPSAGFPPIEADQLQVLQQIGRHWDRAIEDPAQWRRALPVDPTLGLHSPPNPTEHRDGFRSVAAGSAIELEAGEDGDSGAQPGTRRFRRLVLGPALRSTAIATERMRKLVALPVLSADALSSVAYGPEAMLAVLVLAGSAGLGLSLPIAGAIACSMLVVGLSYRQTIRAYPNGGGSYIVASDNLGRVPGLMAAAGLMTDYVLTVAVSVSAGVAAASSAVPSLSSLSVPLAVAVIVVLLAGNLRGVRQGGALFAAPTYAFLVAMTLLVVVGLTRAGAQGFHAGAAPAPGATQGLGLLLVLRAFASGATAMTGIEAISNAVPAFQPPGWRNARRTLSWMVGILIVLFAGTVVLVHLDGLVPRENETLLSQLAHRSFGAGPLYVLALNGAGATVSAVMLVVAAVTKFAGGAWVAIVVVGLIVVVAVRIRRYYDALGRVLALHPEAVQVPRRLAAPISEHEPAPVAGSDTEGEESPDAIVHLTIVPVASIDLASVRSLAYAGSLGQPVLAVHVAPSEAEAERFRRYWRAWGDHLPLAVLVSPYRSVVAPLIHYVEALHRQRPDLTITTVVPEVVLRSWWHRALHNRTETSLRRGVRSLPKIVVTTVPVHLPR